MNKALCFFAAILAAFTIASCRALPSSTTTLCLEGLKLKAGERIIAFDLNLVGATFESLPTVPIGWTIEISNDSNGLANAKAGIIDFAAAVSPKRLGCIATLRPSELAQEITAKLTIWVQVGDEKERKIEVSPEFVKISSN